MTKFLKGVSGNAAGRPKGSRNLLSQSFLDSLYADFESHGVGVIAKVREENPSAYLKVVANLMPARLEAQLEAQVDVNVGFRDTDSISDVLAQVAKEAGTEAAMQLAAMFGIDDPSEAEQVLLPPAEVCRSGDTYMSQGAVFPYICSCRQCSRERKTN